MALASMPMVVSPGGIVVVQPLHYNASMPTIQRFSNCKIRMYAADHLPPHFHVCFSDGREVLVEICSLKPLQVNRRVRARELESALAWASDNQDVLEAKWRELNP